MNGDFGQTLKHLRESRELSQSRVADLADFDHSYVSRLESGARTPTRDAVSRLADALRLDPAATDALLHAAGFLNGDDPALLHDDDLRDLAAVLGDPTLPDDYRRLVRTNVRGLIDGARFVRREMAVPA